MRFSLKSLMIAIFAIALTLVLPSPLLRLVERWVWCLLPTVLVAHLIYGNARQRALATGSLTAYVAMTWQAEAIWIGRPFVAIRWVLMLSVLGLAGWSTDWWRRRLGGASDEAIVPPPPPAE